MMCIGVAVAVFFWAMGSTGFDGDHSVPAWLPVVGIFSFMVGLARVLGWFSERKPQSSEALWRSPMSEGELIRRAAGGTPPAFAALVHLYQSRLRGFLRRMTRGEHALADDLAQETFLEAYRKIGSYRGEGSFSGWLYAIAWSRYLMAARRRKLEPLETWRTPRSRPHPETARRAAPRSEKAMSRLAPAERAALTVCFALTNTLVFLPMAGKLDIRAKEEYQRRELVIEGIAAIQLGEKPQIIKERLEGLPRAGPAQGHPVVSDADPRGTSEETGGHGHTASWLVSLLRHDLPCFRHVLPDDDDVLDEQSAQACPRPESGCSRAAAVWRNALAFPTECMVDIAQLSVFSPERCARS